MKKVLLLLLLAFPMTPIYADFYHGVGRDLNLTVYQFDNEKLFIIKYDSKGKYLVRDNTIIKLLLKNGEVVRLEENSKVENTKNKSTSWISGIETIKNQTTYTFCFEITPEILKIFDIGIKKIAINTLPEVFMYVGDDLERVHEVLKEDYDNLKDEF